MRSRRLQAGAGRGRPSWCATTPGRLEVVFFNQPWRAKQLEQGTEAIFFGKVGEYRGTRQMVNPVVDVVAGDDAGAPDAADPARLPGLGQGRAHQLGDRDLRRGGARAGRRVPRPAAAGRGATTLDLWGRTEAIGAIHGPESIDVMAPARRRLVFDELFRLQLALVLRRRAFEDNARALRHDVSPREVTGAVARHPGGAVPGRRCPTSSPRRSAGRWR